MIDERELKFVNSPLREFFQKYHEFRIFRGYLARHHIDLTHTVILDVGCGSGYSTSLLSETFHPSTLLAFDVMVEQVTLARKRGVDATFFVGDASSIGIPSEACDAVFIFGVLHHIPRWRDALAEVGRVLKKGGVLLGEEFDKKALDDAEKHLGIYHAKEARFTWEEVCEGLRDAGLSVVEAQRIYLGHMWSFLCSKK